MKQRLLLFLWLGISSLGAMQAQVEVGSGLGLGCSGGLSLQFGTHLNRLGLSGHLFYVRDFAQVNLHWRGTYQLSGWGPRNPALSGWETQASLGLALSWGQVDSLPNPFVSPVSLQTGRFYGVAYAYNFYFDQYQTTQRTATFGLHLYRLQIATENDALIGGIDDRYRTGSLQIHYRFPTTQVGLNTILWTGDARDRKVKRVTDSDYPSRFGYKDLSEARYGRFSHGILAATLKQDLGFGQLVEVQAGLDAEQIRHGLQNRFIHDMMFVPDGIIKAKNVHYPMLTPSGEPYLYRPDQRIRPARFFFQAGLNPEFCY